MSQITLLATGERLVGRGVRAFSPVLEELLRSASREIQVAVYRIDASAMPLLEVLETAALRGVDILIVVSSVGGQPRSVREKLERMKGIPGVQVVDFQEKYGGLLHTKVVVVDRRQAVIGSANLTWGGLVQNHEIGILIEGPEAWEVARLLDLLAA